MSRLLSERPRGSIALLALGVGLGICAGPAPAFERLMPELTLPHLGSLPRSEAERARIAAITAPPASFDNAEPFEANPAGADLRTRLDAGLGRSGPAL